MSEKKFAKKPLLYIHQPTVSSPEAPMKHNNMTPKTANDGNQQHRKNRSKPLKRRYFNEHEEIADEMSDKNQEAENDESKRNESKRKFIDMNINEKIDYFLIRSVFTPELKCEFKIDDRNYRGVFTILHDDHVFISFVSSA